MFLRDNGVLWHDPDVYRIEGVSCEGRRCVCVCVCVGGGGGVYNIVGVSEREEGRATRVKLPHSKNTPSYARSKGIAFE